MIFKSGWTKAEIESLTYAELFRLAEMYYKIRADEMFDFFKAFCFYNAESSAVAFNANNSSLRKYLNELTRRKMSGITSGERDIEEEFKGAGFGK